MTIEKKRIEIHTDSLPRLASDLVGFARGLVRYDTRADASGGFDLTSVAGRDDEAIKLRVRDSGQVVSLETYATLIAACYSAVVLCGVSPESIFLYGPARGIDLIRLRGEIALDMDLQKQAHVRKQPSGRKVA